MPLLPNTNTVSSRLGAKAAVGRNPGSLPLWDTWPQCSCRMRKLRLLLCVLIFFTSIHWTQWRCLDVTQASCFYSENGPKIWCKCSPSALSLCAALELQTRESSINGSLSRHSNKYLFNGFYLPSCLQPQQLKAAYLDIIRNLQFIEDFLVCSFNTSPVLTWCCWCWLFAFSIFGCMLNL